MNEQGVSRRDLLWLLSTVMHATTTHSLAQFWMRAENPERAARQWVRREAAKGMIIGTPTVIQPEVIVTCPLLDWNPSMTSPDFGGISYQANKRWEVAPCRRMVVVASPKAKALFGGSLVNRPLRARELNHDIGLGEVFWHLFASDPELPEKWIFEDRLVSEGRHCYGEAIPDAVIRGSPPLLIEFAGRYSAKKLRSIHKDYSHNHYQLW